MTDIVERLREAAKMPKEKFMVDVALNEAADEIERLRALPAPPAATHRGESARQIVQALLSKCDPSNWDADGYKGDEYRIRKEVYDEFHEFAGELADLLEPVEQEQP